MCFKYSSKGISFPQEQANKKLRIGNQDPGFKNAPKIVSDPDFGI